MATTLNRATAGGVPRRLARRRLSKLGGGPDAAYADGS